MSTTQDLKKIFYNNLGFTGAVPDMEKANLSGLVGFNTNFNDMLYAYLGQLGFTGSLPDRLSGYLRSLGYTGSLDDMVKRSLEDNTYLNGAFEGTTLYLRFDTQYYNFSDYLCYDNSTLILDFRIQNFVVKQPCP